MLRVKPEARQWYRESRIAIKRMYPEDWELFCGLLAATSARASIKCNVALARKAYNQIKATGDINREGFINSHYKCVKHVLKYGHPSGRKVQALFLQLTVGGDKVPVDIWMMRYAGIDRKAPNKFEYDLIEDRVREEARELGITPGERQAEIWAIARKSSRGYAEALCQYRLF